MKRVTQNPTFQQRRAHSKCQRIVGAAWSKWSVPCPELAWNAKCYTRVSQAPFQNTCFCNGCNSCSSLKNSGIEARDVCISQKHSWKHPSTLTSRCWRVWASMTYQWWSCWTPSAPSKAQNCSPLIFQSEIPSRTNGGVLDFRGTVSFIAQIGRKLSAALEQMHFMSARLPNVNIL